MNKKEIAKMDEMIKREWPLKIKTLRISSEESNAKIDNETVLLSGFAEKTYLSVDLVDCYKYNTKLSVINDNFILSEEDIEDGAGTKERKKTSIVGKEIDSRFLRKYFAVILAEESNYSFVKHLYDVGYHYYLMKSFR